MDEGWTPVIDAIKKVATVSAGVFTYNAPKAILGISFIVSG
jgi:hypothetical protein